MRLALLIVISAMMLSSGCQLVFCPSNCFTKYNGYRGDGIFTDYLWERDTQRGRYEVDFGKVDLAKKNVRTFNFSNLPEALRWMIGLEVYPIKDRLPLSYYLAKPVIRLTLVNQNNKLVMEEEAPINKWPRYHELRVEEGVVPAFLYRPGKSKDQYLGPNAGYESIAVGVKSNQGWGTFFSPKTGQSFKLTVEVVSPDSIEEQFFVKIVARGFNALATSSL